MTDDEPLGGLGGLSGSGPSPISCPRSVDCPTPAGSRGAAAGADAVAVTGGELHDSDVTKAVVSVLLEEAMHELRPMQRSPGASCSASSTGKLRAGVLSSN